MPFCLCRGRDDGRLMIQCDRCEEWYHADCVGISVAEAGRLEEYYCPTCRAPRPTQPCANAGCPRTASFASKYCSRRCGLAMARRRLNYLSKRRAPSGSDAGAWGDADGDAEAREQHHRQLLTVEVEDRSELRLLERARAECLLSMERLQQAEEEHRRVTSEPRPPTQCTYPGCGLAKAECPRHAYWAEIQRDQLALARREQTKSLDRIDQRLRFLRLRIERRNSLAAVLFHRTEHHAVPVATVS